MSTKTAPPEQTERKSPKQMNKELRATSHILGILSDFPQAAQARMLEHIRGIVNADAQPSQPPQPPS